MTTPLCILPWTSIRLEPNSNLSVCCKSSTSTISSSDPDCVDKYANSIYLKEIKSDLEQQRFPSACNKCKVQEQSGLTSERMVTGGLISSMVDIKGDWIPANVEFKPSNLCNLSCRMCNEQFSSSYAKLHAETRPADMVSDHIKADVDPSLIDSIARHAKVLTLSGGEPTLIKEHYDVLQRILELGRQDEVAVYINTNMTVYNPEFWSVLQRFKTVICSVSLDGVGFVGEYIRHGSKWNTVNNNIHDMVHYCVENNIERTFTIHSTIQVYNIGHVLDIVVYVEGMRRWYAGTCVKFNYEFATLRGPELLRIEVLPNQYRPIAIKKLQDLWLHVDDNRRSDVERWIDMLKYPMAPIDEYQYHRFLKYDKWFNEATNNKITLDDIFQAQYGRT